MLWAILKSLDFTGFRGLFRSCPENIGVIYITAYICNWLNNETGTQLVSCVGLRGLRLERSAFGADGMFQAQFVHGACHP